MRTSPTKRPPTEKFHKRRDVILHAAVGVLNQKGVRGMTLADVAATLDQVPTAITYYFRSKEELAALCFYEAIEVFEDLLRQAAPAGNASEGLAIFVRQYFDLRRRIATGEAHPIAFFNDVRALGDPGVGEAYVAMFRNTRQLLLKSRRIARLERVECNARTHLLLSTLFWAVAWLPRYDPEDYPRLANHTLDILEHGFAGDNHPWAPRSLGSLEPPETDKSSDAREAFLREATTLMNEQGYSGTSIQKVSERLNFTKGAFYHHHEAKDDLVEACFARTLDIMRRAQRRAAAGRLWGYANLASVSAALIEYQLSGNSPLLRTSALTSVPQNIHDQLIDQFEHFARRLSLEWTDGIVDGSLRPVDATIAAQMIVGMINASAEVQAWAPGITAQTGARIYARPLFEGLWTT